MRLESGDVQWLQSASSEFSRGSSEKALAAFRNPAVKHHVAAQHEIDNANKEASTKEIFERREEAEAFMQALREQLGLPPRPELAVRVRPLSAKVGELSLFRQVRPATYSQIPFDEEVPLEHFEELC